MKQYQPIKPCEISDFFSDRYEMSTSQLEFLCGLLRDCRPRKIVEVGVSAGGTTVEMLRCIRRLDIKCEMYSVDLEEKYYQDKSKKCGYLIEELKKESDVYDFHTLYTGNILPAFFDKIGCDIDFLILDTTHILPGEILDFLAVFHRLSPNAMVVLHDTILHHYAHSANAIATSVLFQSVTADKFINNDEEYPNIAAFRINEDTEKYIMDVFGSLIIPWVYMPSDAQIKIYDEIFFKEYGEGAFRLWDQAKEYARKFISDDEAMIRKMQSFFSGAVREKVIIYGTGKRGRDIYNFFEGISKKVEFFVVSDGQEKADSFCDCPVYYFSEIPEGEYLIIKAAYAIEIKNFLDKQGRYEYVDFPEMFWRFIE